MSSYAAFADYYDALTTNVDYERYADYLCALLQKLHHEPGVTLDLACGTGNLTLALANRGLDVFGVDGSPDMLSVAQQKASEQGKQILFVCQKMQRLELYSTVNTVVCALDSINHMTVVSDVQKAFACVSRFLEPDGYFIFDANTIYKHREILGNETYIYDTDSVFCAWQNQYDPADNTVEITLDFFAEEDGMYIRQSEQFKERAYPLEHLREMLQTAGLELVHVYDGLSFDSPKEDTQRVVFVAKKPIP